MDITGEQTSNSPPVAAVVTYLTLVHNLEFLSVSSHLTLVLKSEISESFLKLVFILSLCLTVDLIYG